MEKTTELSSTRTILALLAVVALVLIVAFAIMSFRSGSDGLLPNANQPQQQEVAYVCPDGSMYLAIHQTNAIEVAGTKYNLDANSGHYMNEASPVSFIVNGDSLQALSGGETIATCTADAQIPTDTQNVSSEETSAE